MLTEDFCQRNQFEDPMTRVNSKGYGEVLSRRSCQVSKGEHQRCFKLTHCDMMSRKQLGKKPSSHPLEFGDAV